MRLLKGNVMTGRATLLWYNPSTEKSVPLCVCVFDNKGRLLDVNDVKNIDRLPVICRDMHGRVAKNLVKALSEWLIIRDRWMLRPDFKENPEDVRRRNNYKSVFDGYSFQSLENDIYSNRLCLNYPLKKEISIINRCAYSRETLKDSTLYRVCDENKMPIFDMGVFDIKDDTLYWKTSFDINSEYIPFIEYVKPFFKKDMSKAQSVIECCRFYEFNGWKSLFLNLASLDRVVDMEKDLDYLFVRRNRKNINEINGLTFF